MGNQISIFPRRLTAFSLVLLASVVLFSVYSQFKTAELMNSFQANDVPTLQLSCAATRVMKETEHILSDSSFDQTELSANAYAVEDSLKEMIALTNEFSEVSSKFSNSQSYLSFKEISRKDFVGLDKSGLFPQLRNDVQTLVEEYLFKKNEAIKQQVIFGQVSSIVTVVGFIFFLFLILAIYRRYQSNAQTLVQVTHSLELERLASIQSSKLASLGEMAAGLAHEINNPLAVIIGRAEMIMTQISEGSATDVEVSKTISKINDMAFRISKIVTSMRKISKGAVNNDLASINLNSVIEDILNLSSERLRTSLIILDRSGVDSDLNVMASFTQLSQVIINLFNNSVDELIKMPEENRSIVLSTEQIGSEVILRISDSGQGIPDAVRKKLFEPFFTTKEVGKGTGLGLSISKGLMIDMGGNLELSPDLNQTCFILKLQKA